VKFVIPEQHGKGKNLQQQEKQEIQVPPYEEENVTHQYKVQGTRHTVSAVALAKAEGTRKGAGCSCTVCLVTCAFEIHRITNGYLS
jgi:hypothetical protein